MDDKLPTSCIAPPSLAKLHVSRPRLLASLNEAEMLPLILVSSPAGTGKTSLLADWAGSTAETKHAAWVTFEEAGDADAFWRSVVQAFEHLGVAVSSTAFASGPAAVDRHLLTSLCGAVARHPFRLTLVLDGYEFTSAEVSNDLDFLLRHSGHRLQLVILTRVDPVLPLYRYRLEEKVAEIRMADLAFTNEEASHLLRKSGVHLSKQSARALNQRTKGWAAGLRFAAMILAERDDPDDAVADVAGDTGNIAEYLVAEVLEAQRPEIRELLLNTSILETLQPGAVEELGGPSAGRELARLSKANAFVDALVEHPGSYRYHPFFKEMLRAELAYESPQRLVQLHRKAAEWYAHQGLLAASVSHRAAIDAWEEAAGQLVDDLAVGQLLLGTGSGDLAGTMRQMPSDVVDPAASVVRAALALAARDTDGADAELARAREASDDDGSSRHRGLVLASAVLEAVRAAHVESIEAARQSVQTAEMALRAREYGPRLDAHPELWALVRASKGTAAFRAGELAEASEAFAAGAEASSGPGCEPLCAECLAFLALIAAIQGHLASGRGLAARSIAAADAVGVPAADRPPAAQVALAWVSLEEYDLHSALRHVKLARQSHLLREDPVSQTLAAVVKARLLRARGDLAGALAIVRRATAEVSPASGWLNDRLRIEAASLLVANGETDADALDLESIEGPGGEAEVAIVLAQAELEQGDFDAAQSSLAPVLVRDGSLNAQVTGSLLAVAQELRRGQHGRARLALERALRLAAHETLRRPFREASPAVRQFLAREPDLVAQHPWLGNITSRSTGGVPKQRQAAPGAQDAQVPPTPIVEALTPKELEVLGYLSELLSTEEIARTMFVSVNTIRTHVRSILRKLAVSRRNQAVRRARELSLIGASAERA